MRITPTVGRVVLYRKSTNDTDLASVGNNALAAIIAAVWSDTMVNLHVIDANGVGHSRTSVRLLQEDEEDLRIGEGFAYWMPYQKGQAAKNDDDIAKLTARIDALEAALAELVHRQPEPERQQLTGEVSVRVPSSLQELSAIGPVEVTAGGEFVDAPPPRRPSAGAPPAQDDAPNAEAASS